jgi:hypothetical protein
MTTENRTGEVNFDKHDSLLSVMQAKLVVRRSRSESGCGPSPLSWKPSKSTNEHYIARALES